MSLYRLSFTLSWPFQAIAANGGLHHPNQHTKKRRSSLAMAPNKEEAPAGPEMLKICLPLYSDFFYFSFDSISLLSCCAMCWGDDLWSRSESSWGPSAARYPQNDDERWKIIDKVELCAALFVRSLRPIGQVIISSVWSKKNNRKLLWFDFLPPSSSHSNHRAYTQHCSVLIQNKTQQINWNYFFLDLTKDVV